MTLAPNGRIIPEYDSTCQDDKLYTMCEYQACYTIEGKQCIFPFTYKDVKRTSCINDDIFHPWCPTGNKKCLKF